ncbi:MAG: uridine diphosphate-N-acetylglucosamine-binding protein YvcK [Pyrinomonadaceae bacterium]|nr:uridine diphosphate-N-acetylglucosamine-binding protein YvcK [Pyrinomonadaceae bacterium]
MKNHIFSTNLRGYNVVSIGGGTGLSTVLSGLKEFVKNDKNEPIRIEKLSAIVAVSDDGGSSGRLRNELKMLAPGDVRNCMVALSEDSHSLYKLFKHRFSGTGELGGHSFGNLFLAALTEITGDFAEAVKLSSEILASKGHIYPATNADVHLVAELHDGIQIRGETKLSKMGRAIKKVSLHPEKCQPLPEALQAINEADVITIGPGSLFTSLIPPLLVEGVAETIVKSDAIKIFICNLMTQPGETNGFSAHEHLEKIKEHAPFLEFDYVVVNNFPISHEQLSVYADEGAEQIGVHGSISTETIHGAEIIYENLLDKGEKVRHSPEKLAQIILFCAMENKKLSVNLQNQPLNIEKTMISANYTM